jgi:capsular exopolysaccharide synthesis family protein
MPDDTLFDESPERGNAPAERSRSIGSREPGGSGGRARGQGRATVPDERQALGADDLGGSTLRFDATHLLDYVRMVYKRRWTVLTAFLVVLVGAMLYTYTSVPIYEARAQILIESDTPNVVQFKEVIEEASSTTAYYQTQYTLLRSRTLAGKTLEALKYWDHPEFKGGRGSRIGNLLSGIRGLFSSGDDTSAGAASTGTENAVPGSSAPPPGGASTPASSGVIGGAPAASPRMPTVEETAAQSPVIDRFLGRLTVAPVPNSRLVDVRFRSTDPALAARVVNALSTQYIEQNLEFKFLASKEASDWLGERLAEQRKKVEASELALQRYREQSDAVALEDRQNIVVQKLADLNAAVTRAKTLRIEKEANYNQIKAIQNDREKLDTFAAVLSNSYIQEQKVALANLEQQESQLSEKLGERHPELIKVRTAVETAQARLNAEIGKVVQSVQNEYQAALAQEQSLVSALEQQKGEALGLNRRGIEYGVLQRDSESNRQIYETLMQRAKETGISGELRTNNIRVVDPAEVPRAPVWPNHGRDILLGLFGGAIFGIGLGLFFEYLDSRIKSPEEIRKHLGLAFLGIVPALSKSAPEDMTWPRLDNGVPPDFAEAFRSVRTNVLFSSAEEGTRVLVITSTGPREGKTLVASNLAIAVAQAGHRVLLIDADMRRPRVHSIFEKRQEPGLSNLMVGNAKASEAVTKSAVPGLWVLPSGVVPPNPAELLGSDRFKDFLGQLDQHFDWVLIDTPPVMAVTDATIVAHEVTGVLFVIGSEMTSRSAARTAVERLDTASSRFVGAVLNRVDFKGNGYYYAQYYRREYGDYYTLPTEAARNEAAHN